MMFKANDKQIFAYGNGCIAIIDETGHALYLSPKEVEVLYDVLDIELEKEIKHEVESG
jgi:hypothetical protein